MQVLKKCWSTHTWGIESLKSFLGFLLSACISVISALSLPAQTRDEVLKEYLTSLDGYDIQTKIEECDFILGSCDSASVSETALKVFRHFRDSKLMGDENVAVHVADRWILGDIIPAPENSADGIGQVGRNHNITCLSDSTLSAIRSYADFNRASLLGAAAPLLPEAGLEGFSTEKPTVLWFYDTDCAKCKIESIRLEDFFRRRNDCELVTFYIGDDTGKWKEFLRSHFTGIPDAHHLCDPAETTDFRRKYSVTATPRMFLIDTEGIIIGRLLDVESLELLLDERTRREKSAITDLFYQLIPLRGEDAKNALEYLIDTRILCDGSPFNTAEDSLMVVNFATIQKELLSKARPGTKIAPIKVRGSLNGGKSKEYRLDRLNSACGRHRIPTANRKERREQSGKTVIVFHTTGCHQCEAELNAAKSMGINVLEVNIDDVQSRFPETFARLLDSFDLTALPFLVETDSHGIILRRYFSLTAANK